MLLGLAFLFLTGVAELWAWHDDLIWKAALPGRWTILACYFAVFAANLALLLISRKAFSRDFASSYIGLFARCGLVYFIIAAPAIVIDHENNLINRHYLDQRRPEAYVVTNPDVIREFVGRGSKAGIGPDLAALLNDPEFGRALRAKKFYKQDFDEAFQVLRKAVIFGYKVETRSPQDAPMFPYDSVSRGTGGGSSVSACSD